MTAKPTRAVGDALTIRNSADDWETGTLEIRNGLLHFEIIFLIMGVSKLLKHDDDDSCSKTWCILKLFCNYDLTKGVRKLQKRSLIYFLLLLHGDCSGENIIFYIIFTSFNISFPLPQELPFTIHI